jgi:hypothetical protein
MTRGRDVVVGADVVGAILSIVTSTTALKAFGESRSWESSDRNVDQASGSR